MLSEARARLLSAEQRVESAKIALAEAESRQGLAAPSEAEAGLSEARSQVEIVEALLEKTRVRAPSAGRVLHVDAKAGQLLAPQPGRPVVSLGDVSSLQVIAEVDEVDVAKVRLAQNVAVKSLSHPGRIFKGQVVKIAPALGPARIGSRGPRRRSDVEVVEVTVELNAGPAAGGLPLLPGMRADVYFEG